MARWLLAAAAAWLLWRLARHLWRRARPPHRDVSRLGGEAAFEVVDVSAGPLKPGHHRLALRDGRLLPKPGRLLPWGKRPRVMSRAEATRLFAATLRTRDRNLRDLKTDHDQLRRHGLPEWDSEAQVAEALQVPLARLHHYAIHRDRERVCHYVSFAIPKRNGGERIILAPKRELKALQRRLDRLLVSQLPVSDAAHGFRRGRSIVTNAQGHVGHAVVLKLDLQDFFPGLHVGRVRGLLVALGYSYPVAATLAVLMTECPRQPVRVGDATFHVPAGSRHAVQGAPTSPGLANAIARKLDHRLHGLARAHGFHYTRYADDLAFSGPDVAVARRMIKWVESIVRSEGFRLNRAKTRLMTQAGAQRIAGVTVNRELGWSRRERRRLRAALHQAAGPGAAAPDVAPQPWQRLQGRLAFVRMLNPGQAERLMRSRAAGRASRPRG